MRDLASDAQLGQRLVIELAARRKRARKLELRERGLRIRTDVTVDRAVIEAEMLQSLLHELVDVGGLVLRQGDRAKGEQRAREEDAVRERSERSHQPSTSLGLPLSLLRGHGTTSSKSTTVFGETVTDLVIRVSPSYHPATV